MMFVRVLFCFVAFLVLGALSPTSSVQGDSDTHPTLLQAKKKPSSALANKKHLARIKHNIHRLMVAKKSLAAHRVKFGGHQEKALRHISSAIHDLRILEKHIRQKAK